MAERTKDKYVIIGAGAFGTGRRQEFLARGIAFDCLEREADIGGLWNIATPSGIVYETTHLVSSISSTGFDDLPMLDEDYPEYPSHERVLSYFRDYIAKFGLGPSNPTRQGRYPPGTERRRATGRSASPARLNRDATWVR